MAIYCLLEGSSFDPEAVRAMTKAYEHARQLLGLHDRSDSRAQALAKKIIELAEAGERDPDQLGRKALMALGS
jgi:hypothetical protein